MVLFLTCGVVFRTVVQLRADKSELRYVIALQQFHRFFQPSEINHLHRVLNCHTYSTVFTTVRYVWRNTCHKGITSEPRVWPVKHTFNSDWKTYLLCGMNIIRRFCGVFTSLAPLYKTFDLLTDLLRPSESRRLESSIERLPVNYFLQIGEISEKETFGVLQTKFCLQLHGKSVNISRFGQNHISICTAYSATWLSYTQRADIFGDWMANCVASVIRELRLHA